MAGNFVPVPSSTIRTEFASQNVHYKVDEASDGAAEKSRLRCVIYLDDMIFLHQIPS